MKTYPPGVTAETYDPKTMPMSQDFYSWCLEHTWWRGHHHYGICPDCSTVVRINKPFLGSMHSCVPWPDRVWIQRELKRAVKEAPPVSKVS
jgi:hypothetical protein